MNSQGASNSLRRWLLPISTVAVAGIAGGWLKFSKDSPDIAGEVGQAAKALSSADDGPKRTQNRRSLPRERSEGDVGAARAVPGTVVPDAVGTMAALFERVSARIAADGGRAALEYYQSLSPGDERRMGITESVVALSREESIPVALEMIRKMGPPDVDETTITNLFVPKNEDDLKRVMQGLKSLADPRIRGLAIDQIAMEVKGFSAESLQVLVGSSELSEEEREVAGYCYAMKMAEEDPEEIAALFDTFSEGQQGLLVGKIVGAWPSDDIEGCSKWLFANCPNQRALAEALWRMISIHGAKRPDLVMKVIEEAPASGAADRAHGQLINLLYDRDRGSAETWVSQLQDGPGRDNAIRAYMERLMREDPASAAAFAERTAHGEEDLNRQFALVGHLWAQTDPRAALSWLEQQKSSSPETAASARTIVFRSWAMTNPQEFAASAKSDPAMIESPDVVGALTQAFAMDSPGKAVKWLVESDKVAVGNFSHLMREWIRIEPTAASHWVRDMESGEARELAIKSIIEAVEAADPALAQEWSKQLGK